MHEEIGTDIILRSATIEDAKTIFIWRNFPETRKFSLNSQEIDWEMHMNWFSQTLQMKDRILLIAMEGTESIGVIRYDIKEHSAEVSIYLVPGLYGKGWGVKLLEAGRKWLSNCFPAIKSVTANILCENIASLKAFKKAGFKEYYVTYQYTMS